MEQWKEYKLEDIGNVVGGATPSTKDATNYDGDIPWITPKDLSNHNDRYIYRGERMITQKGFESCSCKMLPKGSVLFSSRAPIGYVAIAGTDMCTNQGFKSVIPNNEIVDTHFLYYILLYNKAKIEGMGSGTTFKEVSGNVMKSVTVSIPNLTEQKRIADFLSSLDDKIELNRRINDNLEQQAQALFKSWFVDFEPFKDGEFVDSELGMIPKGWRVGNIFDVANIFDNQRKPLSASQREYMDKLYPYYGATSCMDFVDDYIFDGVYTLIGEDGSVVKENGLPFVQYVWGKFWVNNHAHVLQGKNGFSTEMLYVFLSKKNIGHLVTGAVQAKLNQANMGKLYIPIPTENVTINLISVFDEIFKKKRHLCDENNKLTLLRDTLLPRLMSGELKINDLNC